MGGAAALFASFTTPLGDEEERTALQSWASRASSPSSEDGVTRVGLGAARPRPAAAVSPPLVSTAEVGRNDTG
ncbi:hypothetical protein DKG34_08970 [Streptomyces sp. NWU49]|nr:hypothetical protein DKG34_08970 [Streptomyces sp. NWU49]